MSRQEEMDALDEKLKNPKLTEAEREEIRRERYGVFTRGNETAQYRAYKQGRAINLIGVAEEAERLTKLLAEFPDSPLVGQWKLHLAEAEALLKK